MPGQFLCMAMSGQNAHCQPEEASNTSTIDTTVASMYTGIVMLFLP